MKIFCNYLVISVLSLLVFTVTVQCSKDSDVGEAEGLDEGDSTVSVNSSIEGYTINDDADTIEDEEINIAESHGKEEDYEWDGTSVIDITLQDTFITTSATTGVTIDGTMAIINTAATYRITGALEDGRIIVDTDDETTVRLILNGVDITSNSSSPLAIMNAEKTVVILAADTENILTDASTYIYENEDEDEPDAALFSDDDLTIYGRGMLRVNGNYNEAIKSKDGLILKDANIAVNSVDDGIQGKDYLIIDNGTYVITTNGDGLKSSNDEDAKLGYIQINSGSFTIEAVSDAIQAESDLIVYGGDFVLNSGGGSSAGLGDDDSAKGLKGGNSVIIAGSPTFDMDTADDGIHSDNRVAIYGGTFNVATGDDGIHSDDSLIINGGDINITKSYEGIEGAAIGINGGNVHIVSSDDGLNAAGDGNGTFTIDINGGYVFINASGDGIDANGNIGMTHGVVIVNGPTARGNGTLDYDGSFVISGGFLLAVGSADMLQGPSAGSSQYSIKATLSSTMTAGNLINLQNSEGTTLFTFAPAKAYRSVVFSSPEVTGSTTFKLYLGGSSTGSSVDGLYSDGVYTSGTLFESFTVSSVVTSLN